MTEAKLPEQVMSIRDLKKKIDGELPRIYIELTAYLLRQVDAHRETRSRSQLIQEALRRYFKDELR